MKKLFTYSIIAFMVGLSFISCEKEQSEFNFADITDSARIEGVIYYDQGLQSGEGATIQYTPADSVKVLIKVPYANYSGATTVTRPDKIFEVMTSETGEYSVKIPVGKSAFTGVKVEVVPFEASYFEYINQGPLEIPGVLYDNVDVTLTSNADIDLLAGQVIERNLLMQHTTVSNKNKLTNPIKIQGTVYSKREKFDATGVGTLTPSAVSFTQASCAVYLELMYNRGASPADTRVLRFEGTSAADGTYSFDAKFYEHWAYESVTVTVTTKDFRDDTFIHHYKIIASDTWDQQTLGGVFDTMKVTKSDVVSGDRLLGIRMGDISLTFRPENINIIKGIGNTDVDNPTGTNLLYEVNNPMQWDTN